MLPVVVDSMFIMALNRSILFYFVFLFSHTHTMSLGYKDLYWNNRTVLGIVNLDRHTLHLSE